MQSCLQRQREKEAGRWLCGELFRKPQILLFHSPPFQGQLPARTSQKGRRRDENTSECPCTGGGKGGDLPCAACRGEAVSPC